MPTSSTQLDSLFGFVDRAEEALKSGRVQDFPNAELQRVMTAAIRLYAAKVQTQDYCAVVTPSCISPTEAVIAITALLKETGLNLWDLSMWYSRFHRDYGND